MHAIFDKNGYLKTIAKTSDNAWTLFHGPVAVMWNGLAEFKVSMTMDCGYQGVDIDIDALEPVNGDVLSIGTDVIYEGEVCTTCKPENNGITGKNSGFDCWIDNHLLGYKHGVAISNLKAIPATLAEMPQHQEEELPLQYAS